ncbi:MAG: prolipoprotein diacylglyceryl transferase [Planctomycetia bacterium]|nr:prolipoprotein diacylglyceryl transferase [Planctomycetia bacterium]
MRQTLFYIPHALEGFPLFGWGLVLLVWAIASAATIAVNARRHGFGPAVRGYAPVLMLMGGAILFVLPLLEKFEQGRPLGLPIQGYGVMLLLGVVAGVMTSVWRAPAARIDPEIVFSLAFWMFAAGILGARAFHVIEYWDQSYSQPTWQATLGAIVNIPKGGLVVYGSLIAVTLMLPVFIWRNRLPGLALCDLIAPSMVLGLALGRVGCLLNGCCYGGPADYTWAIRFPAGSIPYDEQQRVGLLHGIRIGDDDKGHVTIHQVNTAAPREAGLKVGDQIAAINGRPIDSPQTARWLADEVKMLRYRGGAVDSREVARALLTISGPELSIRTADGREAAWSIGKFPTRSLPIHPAQIYSSIDALLICAFLLAYYPYRRRDGEVFALLLTIYPITRFMIEILRMDEPAQFHTGLSIAQLVSLVGYVGVIALWVYLLRKPKGQLWADVGPPVLPANR